MKKVKKKVIECRIKGTEETCKVISGAWLSTAINPEEKKGFSIHFDGRKDRVLFRFPGSKTNAKEVVEKILDSAKKKLNGRVFVASQPTFQTVEIEEIEYTEEEKLASQQEYWHALPDEDYNHVILPPGVTDLDNLF